MTEETLARRARSAAGLSQREFAKLIGVNHVTQAKWETSAWAPSKPAAALLRVIEAAPKLCVRVLRRGLAEDAAELDELAARVKAAGRGADDVRALKKADLPREPRRPGGSRRGRSGRRGRA